MRNEGLYSNKFLNKNILIFIVVILIMLLGNWFYVNDKLKEYQSNEIIMFANTLGAIEKNIQAGDDAILYMLDENINNEYVNIGLKHLEKYGYTKEMTIDNKWIGKKLVNTRNSIFIIQSTISVIILVISLLVIYSLMRRINRVTYGLIDLSNGKEFKRIEDNTEGSVAKLYHSYNMTGIRMKRWISELEEERNLIKELLNDLSHQLKTPIASLNMNTELILEGYTDLEESKSFLENNKENIDRLQWISEGLLQLAKLETQSIVLSKKERNLKDTILGAINSTYGKAISKDIHIEVDKIDDFVINHDERWTKEAIINIIDNAIKYNKENDSIRIYTKRYDMKIQVVIEDFGIGIDKKDIDNIFKRFYRSFNEKVQAEEGSGIGLYLSKKIIEEQYGNIRVYSEINKGSKFVITMYKKIIS